MQLTRRALLNAIPLAAATAYSTRGADSSLARLGIPGRYRGRVIEVYHPASIVSGAYQAEPIRQMMYKGMMELTCAPAWPDAWKVFFERGDVVGIKVSPVGGPKLSSDSLVLHQVVDGLIQAGVRPRDIIVFNRYRQEMFEAGIHQWLPPDVRLAWAVEAYDKVQLSMEGYDPDHYMDMALVKPGQDIKDDHLRRSYVVQVLTKQINKMINLPVVKHHTSAGVTLALKNMSHGLVNNVNRSHSSVTLNACGTFIPASVNTPVIREKAILHILDGVKASYHGGPGARPEYLWENKTMYFATDPVALDKTGWRAIDAKRVERGLEPVAIARPDAASPFLRGQVEHIEIAGALGLGEFDDAKIDLKKFSLS